MQAMPNRPKEGSDPLRPHLKRVVDALADESLVPFLGSAANLCSREAGGSWLPDQQRSLPLGGELARYLAESFDLAADAPPDLARISEQVVLTRGSGPLYSKLRSLLDADYPVTSLHSYFAGLPERLRARRHPKRHFLLVTTNYDDLLERAFADADEPYHSVIYSAEGAHRGKFLHRPPGGQPQFIQQPNKYQGLMADQIPVILKLHGTVDRETRVRDSFVVTETHYIDYLTRTDISSLLPVPLPAILEQSSLLFLGYSLRDWNLRVILHRIWSERTLSWKSWAVLSKPDELECKFWERRDIEVIDHDVCSYIAALDDRTRELLP